MKNFDIIFLGLCILAFFFVSLNFFIKNYTISKKNATDVNPCNAGETLCVDRGGSVCKNLNTDVNHCGACFTSCSIPIDGYAQCIQGQCI